MNPNLAVVLRDVGATYPIPVQVSADTGRTWITTDGVSKAGFEDCGLTEIAGLVADWLVECLPAAGYPAVWPECPLHPGPHPLVARDAAWVCPVTAVYIAGIGSLRT